MTVHLTRIDCEGF